VRINFSGPFSTAGKVVAHGLSTASLPVCASQQVICIRTIPRRSALLHDRSSVVDKPFALFAQWPGVGITQDDRFPNWASHSHNSHNSFAATSRLPEPVLNSQTGSQYSQNYVLLGVFQGFCDLPVIRRIGFNIRTIAADQCFAPARRFQIMALFAQFAELPATHGCMPPRGRLPYLFAQFAEFLPAELPSRRWSLSEPIMRPSWLGNAPSGATP
jgi:hypothetical protein